MRRSVKKLSKIELTKPKYIRVWKKFMRGRQTGQRGFQGCQLLRIAWREERKHEEKKKK